VGTAGVSEPTLELIYARHRRALFALALSTTGSAAAAEDAVHDAFVRLCRRGIAGTCDPVAYVFAAVRNAALDQARPTKPARELELAALSLFESPERGPHDDALAAERNGLVAEAIDALPTEQREAVLLRVYANLSFSQAAAVIGVPLQTVATRYRRALHRLRDQLEKLV
jgi:RNA polymerase sigma-70 factor (ECF subfamily)